MNIGLAGMFSWRPHMEHLVYIGKILQKESHKIYYLTCDSKLSNCYNLELKKQGRFYVCGSCIIGGIRSYPVNNVTSIKKNIKKKLNKKILLSLASSTAYTITRSESIEDFESKDVMHIKESLVESINTVFENTITWINENKIEGVITFNGRMDITQGIIFACKSIGIPYISLERTRDNGLLLKPNENCLGLKSINKYLKKYIEYPLTFDQARIAALDLLNRINNVENKEWRSYHFNNKPFLWNIENGNPKVLFAPSSRSEFEGHPDWESGFSDFTKAFDTLLEKLGLKHTNCILRCHPNWILPISKMKVSKSLKHYLNWAKKNGIYTINSDEKVSTYDLIKQADIVVVNGGTVGIEAGILGKKVICLGHAGWEKSNISINILNNDQWDLLSKLNNHDSWGTIRNTLRLYYFGSYRFPQYIKYVRAIDSLKFEYYRGADANRIIQMFKTGNIKLDDETVADNIEEENKIIDLIVKNKFEKLKIRNPIKNKQNLKRLKINRKFIFAWLDKTRSLLPRGDT